MNKQLDLDKLNDIQDRIADQQAEMEEKREFFVQAGKMEDDDELLDELNELEAEMAGRELEELEIGAGHIAAKEGPMIIPQYGGA